MLTGAIRTQIDQIWNAFWSGGVSNPLSVIEQLTFLLFIKRLKRRAFNLTHIRLHGSSSSIRLV